MEFGFEHVDDEAARRLRDRADHVWATLANVGTPVSAAVGPDLSAGADITVDPGADEAGGVYIAWQLPRLQHDELLSYLLANLHSHPKAQYFFEVQAGRCEMQSWPSSMRRA